MKIKTIVIFSLAVFCITLAIVVGRRMSNEAMAVLLGVMAGVLASIPTSVIVALVTLRMMGPKVTHTQVIGASSPAQQPPEAQHPKYPAPPLVERMVIVPNHQYGQPAAQPYSWQPRSQVIMPPQPREFTVIGGASEIDDLSTYMSHVSLEVE